MNSKSLKSIKFPGLDTVYTISTDNTELEEHVLNNNNPHGVTAAQVGAAPTGYGLGTTTGKDVSGADFNTIIENGWYSFNGGGENMPIPTLGYSYMFVCGRPGSITQFIFQSNTELFKECIYKRTMFNGSWEEWEWVNPPMEQGVEYRTTEQWNGKPVYVQVVDLNALPPGNLRFVYPPTPIAPTAKLVDIFGTIHYSGGNMKPISKESSLDIAINIGDSTWRLDVTATTDLSAHTGIVTLKYCKE